MVESYKDFLKSRARKATAAGIGATLVGFTTPLGGIMPAAADSTGTPVMHRIHKDYQKRKSIRNLIKKTKH